MSETIPDDGTTEAPLTSEDKLNYVYAQAQRMEAFVNEAVPALEALSKHPLLGAFLGKKK